MEFIKIAYCITMPFLLLCSLANTSTVKKYSINLLAVSNILLIGHAVFFIRQLIGGYRLANKLSIDYHLFYTTGSLLVHIILVIVLPFLFLHPRLRTNRVLTVFSAVLLYSVFPVSSWNTYGLLFKIPGYLCLLCSAYALVWLLNKLPYQSPVA